MLKLMSKYLPNLFRDEYAIYIYAYVDQNIFPSYIYINPF